MKINAQFAAGKVFQQKLPQARAGHQIRVTHRKDIRQVTRQPRLAGQRWYSRTTAPCFQLPMFSSDRALGCSVDRSGFMALAGRDKARVQGERRALRPILISGVGVRGFDTSFARRPSQ